VTERVRIAEALRNGIQRDSRLGVNTPYLEALKGLRATEWGLRDFNPIVVPVAAPGTVSWPWNQLFRGKKKTVFCEESVVYSVDESTWTPTALSLKNLFLRGSSATITVSVSPWHFIDFYDSWLLLNGDSMVVNLPTINANDPTTYVTSTRIPQTGCNHKDGRVLLGGFPNGTYWWDGVDNVEEYVRTQFENSGGLNNSLQMHLANADFQNWIWWGSIGVGDFLGLWLMEYLYHGNITWSERLTNGTFTGSATGWTLGANWAYGSNKVTHTAGATAVVSQSNVITAGIYHYYSFTVSGRTAGTVTFSGGGGTLSVAVSSNTTVTGYFLGGTGGHLTITPTTDFDGAIDSLSLIRLSEDFGFTSDNPFHAMLAKRNETGMMPLPCRGLVQKMIPLGDAVVCYTTSGIAAAVSFSNPVSTYGVREIDNLQHIGIPSRGAAGGGEHGHIFMDEGGTLWGISKDLTAERIGYQHVLADFVGADPLIEYDAQHQEWYICGDPAADRTCFVFTRNGGLSKAPWMPTSVSFAEGGIVAGYSFTTDFVSGADEVYLTTGRIRAGDGREESSLNYIILVTQDTDATGWTCYVDYRTEQGVAWTASELFTPDTRGHIRCSVSGIEFRIRLLHPDRTLCDLDEIILEFNDGDRHSVSRLLP
jgi:hypothetical protein